MSKAKSGDTVAVHYTGKLKDGTVFDSSEGRDPLRVQIGENQVIPGFEEALVGMAEGESKSVEIPVDKAYGERQDRLVASVQKSQLPADLKPEVGQTLNVQQEGGDSIQVVVTDVSDDGMTIDANHPLAGEDLMFELELVAIG